MDGTNTRLHALMKTGRLKKAIKGEVLQNSDEAPVLNLIVTGYVKRYRIGSDGSLGVQAIFGPGYFYPLTPVFKILFDLDIYEGPETYYYEAVTDATIWTLDEARFSEGVKKDPTLYRDLLYEAGKRLESNIWRLENLSLQNSYQRVAHYLAYLARSTGVKKGSGLVITLPVTQQDIAESLSVTRETVSLAIRKLRKDGLITQKGKNITLSNIDALEEKAYD